VAPRVLSEGLWAAGVRRVGGRPDGSGETRRGWTGGGARAGFTADRHRAGRVAALGAENERGPRGVAAAAGATDGRSARMRRRSVQNGEWSTGRVGVRAASWSAPLSRRGQEKPQEGRGGWRRGVADGHAAAIGAKDSGAAYVGVTAAGPPLCRARRGEGCAATGPTRAAGGKSGWAGAAGWGGREASGKPKGRVDRRRPGMWARVGDADVWCAGRATDIARGPGQNGGGESGVPGGPCASRAGGWERGRLRWAGRLRTGRLGGARREARGGSFGVRGGFECWVDSPGWLSIAGVCGVAKGNGWVAGSEHRSGNGTASLRDRGSGGVGPCWLTSRSGLNGAGMGRWPSGANREGCNGPARSGSWGSGLEGALLPGGPTLAARGLVTRRPRRSNWA